MIRSVGGFSELPLYFTRQPPFVFERTMTAALASASRRVDENALLDWLADWSQRERVFLDVDAADPWETISLGNEGVTRERAIPRATCDVWSCAPPAALVDETRRRFVEAVARCIAGRSRPCVYLGGTDSSGILGALCQVVPADSLLAVTIRYEGDTHSDVPYAEMVCRSLGVRHWIVDHDNSSLERSLVFDSMPSPSPYAAFDRGLLERLCDRGVDVAISGTMGDGTFGGDLRELAFRPPLTAVMDAARIVVPWPTRLRTRAGWLARGRLPHLAARWSKPQTWVRGKLRTRWPRPPIPPARAPNDRLRYWYTAAEATIIASYNTTISTSLPIRCADPLADDELMAFVATIPIETLNCDGRFRGLFQRVVRPWLPSEVVERANTATFSNRMLRELPLLRDLSYGRELARRGWVDSTGLHRDFMTAHDGTSLWTYLAAEQWLRDLS